MDADLAGNMRVLQLNSSATLREGAESPREETPVVPSPLEVSDAESAQYFQTVVIADMITFCYC